MNHSESGLLYPGRSEDSPASRRCPAVPSPLLSGISYMSRLQPSERKMRKPGDLHSPSNNPLHPGPKANPPFILACEQEPGPAVPIPQAPDSHASFCILGICPTKTSAVHLGLGRDAEQRCPASRSLAFPRVSMLSLSVHAPIARRGCCLHHWKRRACGNNGLCCCRRIPPEEPVG